MGKMFTRLQDHRRRADRIATVEAFGGATYLGKYRDFRKLVKLRCRLTVHKRYGYVKLCFLILL